MTTREGVYVPGDYYLDCDVCGFKKRRSECRKRWDGAMVCAEDFEERHPQDMVQARPERQNVVDARYNAPIYAAATPDIESIRALSPVAWFRFGDGITVTNGGVSRWDDYSGNGRHLLQATAAARPAKQSDGSILFNGTTHFMKCAAFTLAQPVTVYLLARQITWTANDYFYDGNSASVMGLIQDDLGVTPNLEIFAGTRLRPLLGPALNSYFVSAAVFNGANSSVQIDTSAPITGNAGSSNASGFTMGAVANGGGASNIQTKEGILFAAAHDATTRATVIAYLQLINSPGGIQPSDL